MCAAAEAVRHRPGGSPAARPRLAAQGACCQLAPGWRDRSPHARSVSVQTRAPHAALRVGPSPAVGGGDPPRESLHAAALHGDVAQGRQGAGGQGARQPRRIGVAPHRAVHPPNHPRCAPARPHASAADRRGSGTTHAAPSARRRHAVTHPGAAVPPRLGCSNKPQLECTTRERATFLVRVASAETALRATSHTLVGLSGGGSEWLKAAPPRAMTGPGRNHRHSTGPYTEASRSACDAVPRDATMA